MKNLFQSISTSLLLMISLVCYAQNMQEDFESLIGDLLEYEYLTIEAHVEVYDATSEGLVHSQNIEMMKHNDEYFIEINGHEVLYNADAVISVDHQLKSVMMSLRSKEHEQVVQIPDWDFGMQDFVQEMPDYSYRHSSLGHHYSFTSMDGEIDYAEIIIDESKSRLISVEYVFNPDFDPEYGRIKVVYQKFDTSSIPKNRFSVDRFVIKKRGQWILTPLYHSYDLDLFNE